VTIHAVGRASDPPERPTVCPTVVVVLAAGGGSRWTGDGHKLLALIAGEPIVLHSVRTALASGVGPVVVVTGALELPESVTALDDLTIVHHAGWAGGQATSLAAGIAAADALGAEAVVVGLGDQPFIVAESWRAVAASSAPIAMASYDGRARNPVRLARSVWPLLPTTGDEGARVVAQMRPDLVEQVPCPGSPADIDTVDDLTTAADPNDAEDIRQWQSRSSTNSP
jgi:molybdenum cofactor cytidylyltransferase